MTPQEIAFRQAYSRIGGLTLDVIGEFYWRRISARAQQSIDNKHYDLAKRYWSADDSQPYPYQQIREAVWKRRDLELKHVVVPGIVDAVAVVVAYWDTDIAKTIFALSTAMRAVRIGCDFDAYSASREEYLDVLVHEAERGNAPDTDMLTILAFKSRRSSE